MTLDELQKLCDEATPGPWLDSAPNSESNFRLLIGDYAWPMNENNSKFIVAARRYMPLLIDIARTVKEIAAGDAHDFEYERGRDLFNELVEKMQQLADAK